MQDPIQLLKFRSKGGRQTLCSESPIVKLQYDRSIWHFSDRTEWHTTANWLKLHISYVRCFEIGKVPEIPAYTIFGHLSDIDPANKDVTAALLKAMDDKNDDVSMEAIFAVSNVRFDAAPKLARMLNSSNKDLCIKAAWLLQDNRK